MQCEYVCVYVVLVNTESINPTWKLKHIIRYYVSAEWANSTSSCSKPWTSDNSEDARGGIPV